MSCSHTNWSASVAIGNVMASDEDPTIVRRTVELRVECASCGHPLEFQGLPIGVDTHGPTVSPDGLEARLVAIPKGDQLLVTGRVAAIFHTTGGSA